MSENDVIVGDKGMTVLQDGGDDPELDIIFIHGLQGHPESTWTYTKTTGRLWSKKTQTVFWPKALLAQHDSCKSARIMTYGYNSHAYGFKTKVDFCNIQGLAESLRNAVAAFRTKCQHRPLMFIVHSLGGLLVKEVLNQCLNTKVEAHHAIIESAFAIVFFGTPHQGSQLANYGNVIGNVLSFMGAEYNGGIIQALTGSDGMLTKLNGDFEKTVDWMIEHNGFETSTFQESQKVNKFAGKVVEDESSKGGRNDCNDHISADHMNMCKFPSIDDSEYKKVAAEISRHIDRVKGQLDQESNGLLLSLEEFGKFASQRKEEIVNSTKGTLEWLYEAEAHKSGTDSINAPGITSLKKWLQGKEQNSIFWITGKPGSGKSTATKHVLDEPKTREHLGEHPTPEEISDSSEREWVILEAFITNRGSEEQKLWKPMLGGILYQLLKKRPALIRGVIRHARKSESENIGLKVREWGQKDFENALRYCKFQVQTPFRALIVLDGLDELKDPASATSAIDFLKELTRPSHSSCDNTVKVCVSSRSEQGMRDLLADCWRLEIHENTKDDIWRYALARLCQNPRFRDQCTTSIQDRLKAVLAYIRDNADGVFLWASSIVAEVDIALTRREPLDSLLGLVKGLPTQMDELYIYMLKRIDPELRQRAYIMLEVVLRARRPMAVLELFLIVHVAERYIDGKSNLWSDSSSVDHLAARDFLDPCRLQGQLIDCCKCFLEVVPYNKSIGYDYSTPHEESNLIGMMGDAISTHSKILAGPIGFVEEAEVSDTEDSTEFASKVQFRDRIDPSKDVVQLVHRSAKDFLVGNKLLDVLFETPEYKPKGNGDTYVLAFAKAWLQLPKSKQEELRFPFDAMEEVAFHASQVENTLQSTELDTTFSILDDLDQQLTDISGENWPACWYSRFIGKYIQDWHFNFPAFAVAMNMKGYITHLIGNARDDGLLKEFLNPQPGRPLLHFTVYLEHQAPKPTMTKFLLEQGADVNAKYEEKTALESMILHECQANGDPHLTILRHLIDSGADPNTYYRPHWAYTNIWYPLLHIFAHLDFVIDLKPRNDFLHFMAQKGADLNAVDVAGRTLTEVLYWENKTIPQKAWKFLFLKGARITKSMISINFNRVWDWFPVDDAPESQAWALQPAPNTATLTLGNSEQRSPTEEDDSEGMISLRKNEYAVLLPEQASSGLDISLATRGTRDSTEAWSYMTTPMTEEKRRLQGLCDGDSSHNAYKVLQKTEFRQLEWYTEEAAEAAVQMCPDWFRTAAV